MAGFDNEVVYGSNVDFSGNSVVTGQIVTDGQLIIGRTSLNAGGTHIDVNTLTPGTGISITNGAGSITIAASGAVGQTITGNQGGPIAPVSGNWNIITANSTPKFVGTAGTETLDFGLSNLALGSSLPALTTGLRNVGVGSSCLNALTSAEDSCGFGTFSLQSLTSGNSNSCFGAAAGASITTGTQNSSFGKNSLLACVSGSRNCAGGFGSLGNCTTSDNCAYGYSSSLGLTTGTLNCSYGTFALQTCQTGNNNTGLGYSTLVLALGSDNTALGFNAGSSYTGTESSNLMVQNNGVLGESNTIRIGTQGNGAREQNRAFLAGVTGVTVSGSAPVGVDTNGQLSSLGFGTATQVLTSNGAGVSPTWQPLSGVVTSITGGPGITITGTSSVPIINSVIFTDTTATTLAVDNGYFATAAGTYNMPATAAQGEVIEIVCDTTGAVVLDCPASNFIRIGNLITSSGGTATSTLQGDALKLRYRSSTLTWEAISVIGTWLVA